MLGALQRGASWRLKREMEPVCGAGEPVAEAEINSTT
jgi:hypothetical protein